MLSTKAIEEHCIVFDGGNKETHPIQLPDGVYWHCISVGKGIHIEDEVNPQVGLTFSRIDNALPFIQLPRAIARGSSRLVPRHFFAPQNSRKKPLCKKTKKQGVTDGLGAQFC